MSRQGKLAALASTGVTKAELDLLDGVTSTTAELNITDGVTSTAAELNILDGVTATAAEINLIDGGTARGTTAVADGDGFLTNDGGTMRMTSVDTLATYMGTKITGGSMVFIASSGAISNAANVSFTQFDATKYDSYEFHFIDVLPSTDAQELRARTSSDTSSHSYDSGSSDYIVSIDDTNTGSYAAVISGTIGGAANEGANPIVSIINPHTSAFTKVVPVGGAYVLENNAHYNAGANRHGFVRRETAQVNAVQFFFASGNIASGEIVMYGIANGT